MLMARILEQQADCPCQAFSRPAPAAAGINGNDSHVCTYAWWLCQAFT